MAGREAQALAVLYLAGGILGIVSVLLPHWRGLNAWAILIPGGAALALSPVLFRLAARAGRPLLHAVLAAGTLLVSFGVTFAGNQAASATYGLLYVWVGMYAFHVFPWKVAALHIVLVALSYGAALAVAASEPSASQWLLTVGVVTVNGAVVGWLAGRVQESYRRLYEGEQALVHRLEEADRLKEELVANVSQDLRTPINSILGFTRVLRAYGDTIDPRERAEFLEGIERHTERLSRLVGNLLLAAGFSEPDETAATDLRTAVTEAVGMVRAGAAAPLPPIEVSGDSCAVRLGPEPLQQVLVDLLATITGQARGTVGVRLACLPEAARVVVSCEAVPAGEEPAPDGRAVGAGLPILRRLVEVHGGSVRATVEGTLVSVIVDLPVNAERVHA